MLLAQVAARAPCLGIARRTLEICKRIALVLVIGARNFIRVIVLVLVLADRAARAATTTATATACLSSIQSLQPIGRNVLK